MINSLTYKSSNYDITLSIVSTETKPFTQTVYDTITSYDSVRWSNTFEAHQWYLESLICILKINWVPFTFTTT